MLNILLCVIFVFNLTNAQLSINYSTDPRIVNGTEVDIHEFPHQVSLRRTRSQNFFCGGSLITTKWVLSAGHCVFLHGRLVKATSIVVFGGQSKLDEPGIESQKSIVFSFILHPDYNNWTLQNDIALLQLRDPFRITKVVKPAGLTLIPPQPSITCQISGWGYRNQDVNIVSNELIYVEVPIMNLIKCRELLVNISEVPSGMFCAGYENGGKDACKGDSGGGLICEGLLTGLVSGGIGCGRPRIPGLYTDIDYYRNWIIENLIKENGQ